MSVFRSSQNPVIRPEDVRPSREDFEVIGVFNAGVTRFENEVVLLLRVAEKPISRRPDIVSAAVYDVAKDKIVLKEFSKNNAEIDFSDPRLIVTASQTYLTSISHLKVARSSDGVNFKIEESCVIEPANEYEAFGLEDPRISFIDNTYYINYVAVSALGVTTYLASTQDFRRFHRHGVIFCPDNKDIVIFPEKINGKFYALHRPVSPLFGKNEIWISESPDLICWGNHRYLMSPCQDCWDNMKIGAGAVPFRTDAGWLEIYHGVDNRNRYCLGAVLTDAKEPWKIISRTDKPIFEPEANYETEGFFGNVVFSCGLLYEEDRLKIYYGAADTTICYVQIPVQDVLDELKTKG